MTNVLDAPNPSAIVSLLADVGEEMARVDLKRGVQDHPLITAIYPGHKRASYAREMVLQQQQNDSNEKAGRLGWDGILLEEVFEALAEDNEQRAINELVQVACVALLAARSIYLHGLVGGTR